MRECIIQPSRQASRRNHVLSSTLHCSGGGSRRNCGHRFTASCLGLLGLSTGGLLMHTYTLLCMCKKE